MAIVSKYRSIFPLNERPARGGRGKTGNPLGPTVNASDGFLRHRFLPMYGPSENLPARERVEPGFFQSLGNLAGASGFRPMDVTGLDYPRNVLLAHWHAGSNIDGRELLITRTDGKVSLALKQAYHTGNSLYYIPVIPLYCMMKDREKAPAAGLLVSVFAYLYQCCKIPYYTHSGCYLFWQYDMIAEWLLEDPDQYEKQDLSVYMDQVQKAGRIGNFILGKICKAQQLMALRRRLDRFVPASAFDRSCMDLAHTVAGLMEQYRGRTLFDNMVCPDDDHDCTIRAEQYINFFASCRGWLFEQLSEMVNSEFNECGYIEEPAIITFFDKPQKLLKDGLAFEREVFELIGDLCGLLDEYDHGL